MAQSEKAKRLRALLERFARDQNKDIRELTTTPEEVAATKERTEAARTGGNLEAYYDPKPAADNANQTLAALAEDREISAQDADNLEAIVVLRDRPVAYIQGKDYVDLDGIWTYLNAPEYRQRFHPVIEAVGRVDLPTRTDLPYGGTAFIVGNGLMMTNRHVAKEFTSGVGTRSLMYTPGGAAIDFGQERDQPSAGTRLAVTDVVMIHPFWDMALLKVDGLQIQPLKLAVRSPEEMTDQDVVLVGYPAQDYRNNTAQQMRIFDSTFQVKRLQPGKVRGRATVESFKNVVPAMAHDASTLGGNSGSAVVDVKTGQVVGLHFGGVYLKMNFGVPMYELARDAKVLRAGLTFSGSVAGTDAWSSAWVRVDGIAEAPPPPPPVAPAASPPCGATSFTIPLTVTVSLGGSCPTAPAPPAPPPPRVLPPAPVVVASVDATETLKVPVIFDDLSNRSGYSDRFLEPLVVAMPKLTKKAEDIVARLDGGSPFLTYHRFTVVMHKLRRLALFTAANIDWRPKLRNVNGKKPTRKQLTGLGDTDQEKWATDPRIPLIHQLDDTFYTKDQGAFDKGHLVRRDDVAWGDSFADIQKGNGDTYHTTNCSPQVAGFNRGGKGDGNNWGDLENLIAKETKTERSIVFSGPVLDDNNQYFYGKTDRGEVKIQIPTLFWKIIVTKGDKDPNAYGFILEQDLSAVPTHDELVVPPEWERKRASIADIERLLGGWATLEHLVPFDRVDSVEAARVEAKK